MFETVTSTFHNVAVASIREAAFKEAASSFENRFRNLGGIGLFNCRELDYTHDTAPR